MVYCRYQFRNRPVLTTLPSQEIHGAFKNTGDRNLFGNNERSFTPPAMVAEACTDFLDKLGGPAPLGLVVHKLHLSFQTADKRVCRLCDLRLWDYDARSHR